MMPRTLPILLYHSVDDDPPGWIAPFTVSVRRFRGQLDRIVDSGRVPVTAGRVLSALDGGPSLPDNAVLVTFDDGFHDFTGSALPALTDRQVPTTLFVTTGSLRPHNRSLLPPARMMDLAEVAEAAAAGVEIGAHSHTHPQLDTVTDAVVRNELIISKLILEEALGKAVDFFAYPHGYSSLAVRRHVQAIGYRGAFAVGNALSSEHDDIFRVARLTVRTDTDDEQFTRWLRGEGARLAPYPEPAATKVWRTYRRMRARRTRKRPRRQSRGG
jgi:peptidoglycan/xylan/chitin deacetylase (PgdA/CDA1 family)